MSAARVGAILTFFIATSVAGVVTNGGAAYADSPTTQVTVQSNDSTDQVRGDTRETNQAESNTPQEKRHKTPHKKDCSDPRYASYHVYKCTKKPVKDCSCHPKGQKPPKKHTKPQPAPAPVHKTDVNSENNGEVSIGTGSSGTQNGNAATNAGSNATATGNGSTANSRTDVDVDVDNSRHDDHSNSGNTQVVNSGNSTDDHSTTVRVGGHNNAVGPNPIAGHDNVVGDQNVVGNTTTVTQSETKVDKSTTVIDKSVTNIDQSVTNIDNSVNIVNVDNSVHTVNNTTIVQQQQVVAPKAHHHKRGHAVRAVQTVKVKDGQVQASQSVVIKTTPNKHKPAAHPKKVNKVVIKPVAHTNHVVQQAPQTYVPGKTLAVTGSDTMLLAGGGAALVLVGGLLMLGTALPRRRVVSPTESH